MSMNFENQISLGVGIYTSKEIAKILRLPYYKINRWISYWDNKLGKDFNEQYSWKIDQSRAVSFHTMIEFYLMSSFAESGVQSKNILKAHQELSIMLHTAFPFANKNVLNGLKTDGKKIYFEHPDGYTISLDGTKQTNLEVIKMFYKNLEFGGDEMASRLWPLGKTKKIVCDPEIQLGAVTIEGTRIYPETIYEMYKGGESKKFIAETYEITTTQVNNAIEYCSQAA